MKRFAGWLLKFLGWKVEGGVLPVDKAIIIGAPHTSAWDFFFSWLFYKSIGGQANILVKKEFFIWPLGYVTRYMGGIPLDRSRGVSVIKATVRKFEELDRLQLAIAPEGTRQANARWKGGYHAIARMANVPVYLGYYDWGRKTVGVDPVEFVLTDDEKADTKRMRQYYKDKGVKGKFPEMFTTGDDLD